MKKSSSYIWTGTFFIALFIVLAVFAPSLTNYNPSQIFLQKSFATPSLENILGCDNNGSDIFSIIAFGARLSLLIAFLTSFICVFLGLIIGSIAGYMGGKIDALLMRIVDIVFAFPGMILAIGLAAVIGPSKFNIILALSCTGWAGYARLVRGEIRSLKEQEYVEAARALGLPPLRILLFHLWPNLISPLSVALTFGIAGTILAEASLSFLGLGVPPGTPSWGALLFQGRDYLLEAPHISTFPGIAIMLTIFGFNLVGEGLRIQFNPKNNIEGL